MLICQCWGWKASANVVIAVDIGLDVVRSGMVGLAGHKELDAVRSGMVVDIAWREAHLDEDTPQSRLSASA